MNKKEWRAVEQARDLFRLGDRATIGEMKQAYHRMCKKYHPDRAKESDRKKYAEIMCRLTEAHELLMRYTKEYRIPLIPDNKDDIYDPEDWWMHRFGQDPLWSKKRR
jgi:hypothetical protein